MQNDLIVHIAFKIWSSKPVDNLFLCFFYVEQNIGSIVLDFVIQLQQYILFFKFDKHQTTFPIFLCTTMTTHSAS